MSRELLELGELRSLLQQPPSAQVWEAICALVGPLAAEKTVAARTLVPDPEGYAPPDVDFLVGDATAEQPIPPGSTVEQPRPNLEPTVDLRTLASSATGDEQQAQTLLEALTLLERDYEEELTASQVLDMSAVREALGEDFDEPTQVREARLKDAASGKKKS